MKKTETINLGGVIFHIDEDAFSKLQTYIQSIKQHFANTEAADEIAADIEARIAELLQENQVSIVTVSDLDSIIQIMGQPEDYTDEDDEIGNGPVAGTSGRKRKKRLYRHPDDKIIAGICTGLGTYFDVDPLLFRLGFFLTIFAGGFGFYAYAIMWLIVPKANSASDFLKMKGEPITAETIGKTFTEKVENVVSQTNGSTAKSIIRGFGGVIRFVFEWTVKIFGKLLYALKPILGITLLLVGLGITVFTTLLVLVFTGNLAGVNHDMFIEINTLNTIVASSPIPTSLVYTGFILLIGIPVYQLIYLGLRLIFGLARQPNMVVGLLVSGWILALISSIIFTISGATHFADRGQLIEMIDLEAVAGDTLQVRMEDHPDFYWDEGRMRFRYDAEDNTTLVSAVEVRIRKSSDAQFHLQLTREAKAKDFAAAKQIAGHIEYDFDISENALLFDQYLTYPQEDLYHFQEVILVLQIPDGKSVSIDENLHYFINEMNVDGIHMRPEYSNRSQGLVGRTWYMGENGLREEP